MSYAKKQIITLLLIVPLVIAFCFSNVSPVNAKSKSPSKYTWSEKTAPNYVVKIGKAKVKYKVKKGKIKYSKLDKYGRTKKVVGNITYKMVKDSAGWREEFAKNSDPAGWDKNEIVQIKLYNGKYYRGYMWNRSHMIADSLGGKAIRRNLITGTRMQNVGANDGKGGMAYTERKVVSYLYDHQNVNVYYCATPVYKGKELLPRSVIVDIKSSDNKLNERVIVYNAAKGFKINYKNGTFKKTGSSSTSGTSSTTDKTIVYVTKSGKKYHLTKNCSGLKNASKIYSKTKADAVKEGKTLCQICQSNR